MNYFAIDKTAVIRWEKKAEYSGEYVVCVNAAEVYALQNRRSRV